MTGPAQSPVPEGELRISDQDRDRTLEALGQHAAAGRLTLDEHEERASLVLAAKTRDDLAAVTRDLPAVDQAAPLVQAPAAQPAVAGPAARPRRPGGSSRSWAARTGGDASGPRRW